MELAPLEEAVPGQQRRQRQVSASTRTLVHNNYDGWVNPFSGKREERLAVNPSQEPPLEVEPVVSQAPPYPTYPPVEDSTECASLVNNITACLVEPDAWSQKQALRTLGLRMERREVEQPRVKYLTKDAIVHGVSGLLPRLTGDVDPDKVIYPIKQYPHHSLSHIRRDIDTTCASRSGVRGILRHAAPESRGGAGASTIDGIPPITYTSFGDVLTGVLHNASNQGSRVGTQQSAMSGALSGFGGFLSSKEISTAGSGSARNFPQVQVDHMAKASPAPHVHAQPSMRASKGKVNAKASGGQRKAQTREELRTPQLQRLTSSRMRAKDRMEAERSGRTGEQDKRGTQFPRGVLLPLAMPGVLKNIVGMGCGADSAASSPRYMKEAGDMTSSRCWSPPLSATWGAEAADTYSALVGSEAGDDVEHAFHNVTHDDVKDCVAAFLESTQQSEVKRVPVPTLNGHGTLLCADKSISQSVKDRCALNSSLGVRAQLGTPPTQLDIFRDDASAHVLPNKRGMSIVNTLEDVLSPAAKPTYVAPPLVFPNDQGERRESTQLSPRAVRGIRECKALSAMFKNVGKDKLVDINAPPSRGASRARPESTAAPDSRGASPQTTWSPRRSPSLPTRRPVATPSTVVTLRNRIVAAAHTPLGKKRKPAKSTAKTPMAGSGEQKGSWISNVMGDMPLTPTLSDLADVSLDPDATVSEVLDTVCGHFIAEARSAYESGDGKGLSRDLCRYLRQQQLLAKQREKAARAKRKQRGTEQQQQQQQPRLCASQVATRKPDAGPDAEPPTPVQAQAQEGGGPPPLGEAPSVLMCVTPALKLIAGAASPTMTMKSAGSCMSIKSTSSRDDVIVPMSIGEASGLNVTQDSDALNGTDGSVPRIVSFGAIEVTPSLEIELERTTSMDDSDFTRTQSNPALGASMLGGMGASARGNSMRSSVRGGLSFNAVANTVRLASSFQQSSSDLGSSIARPNFPKSERLQKFYKAKAAEAAARKQVVGDLDQETGELKRLRDTLKLIQNIKRRETAEVQGPKIRKLLAGLKLPAKLDKYPTIGEFYMMKVAYEGLLGEGQQGLTLDRMKWNDYSFAGKRLDQDTFRRIVGRHGVKSGQLLFEDVVQVYYPSTDIRTTRMWLTRLDLPRSNSIFGTTDDPGPKWISNYSAAALEDTFSLFIKLGADTNTGLLPVEALVRFLGDGAAVGVSKTELDEMYREDTINLERFTAMTVPTHDESAMVM